MTYSNPLPLSIRVERSGLSMSSGQYFVFCQTNAIARKVKAEYISNGRYHKSGKAAALELAGLRGMFSCYPFSPLAVK